jgi:hypothetical protein
MRRTLSAVALSFAVMGGLSAIASPAYAECIDVDGTGVCYSPGAPRTIHPGGPVSTPPYCLGPLGCQPGGEVGDLPPVVVPVGPPKSPCIEINYECTRP